jgi:deazaflavin-dependent oxidoreductase (nitroreductase family)
MTTTSRPGPALARPRFGGVLWRITRRTTALALPLAGKRWNPVFAVVEHRGRSTGRPFATPVAARRTADGFVVSLAFGAQVDWYRNLMAAGGGTIRWRGKDYAVGRPAVIERASALAAFHPIQRFFLRIGGIDGYISIPIVGSEAR